MSATPHQPDLSEDDLRAELDWLIHRRRTDFGIIALWASALVGVTYWRSGPDFPSHALAALVVPFFLGMTIYLVMRERRERATAEASSDAMRSVICAQLELRVNGFRTMKGVRTALKAGGVVLVFLGVVIVVKEHLIGNAWAGLPMLATTVLWALLFTAWPIHEERSLLPRFERDLAAFGA